MFNIKYTIAAAVLMVGISTASAQNHEHHKSAAQPYAELVKRQIKALSNQDVKGFIEGQGMSLALPAELNGYPGPSHSLEFAKEMGLTEAQKQTTKNLLQAHKLEASLLGKALIEQEKKLDVLFASKDASAGLIDELTLKIGQIHASVRASHLKTHLLQTALLEPHQIAKYQELRGYVGSKHQH